MVFYHWRKQPISADKQKTRVNRDIRARQVRLIDETGEQVGVVSLETALSKAQEVRMDLVEISPNAEPPVCRIMDHGKYVFQQSKRKAAAKKKQRQMQIKELKFRPTIEEGDYQVKLRNLIRFLEAGDKVKITLRFRGRELSHREIGLRILERIEADVAELADIESRPKQEGRQYVMVVVPKKKQ